MTAVIASFSTFLVGFTLIGIWSSRHKTETTEDYLVASRSVNPWLTALSAVSSNNSGYMFVGLIGFTYRSGVEGVWITFGWILGDLLTWFWVHRRVRQRSEDVGASSVPTLLGAISAHNRDRPVMIFAGVATFIFLGLYAAAQLKAGSAATEALFGWPSWLGSLIGAIVVLIYCFSGGIRASIWTDAAQSVVMLISMAVLLGTCVLEVGGPAILLEKLAAISPDLVRFAPQNLILGLGLYVMGWVFAGIGTIGQPHILIRFMAMDSPSSVKKTGAIYFSWYTLFSLFAFGVGLYARILIPELGEGPTGEALIGDALISATERALPTLSMQVLPDVLVGVMLAGLFAATMSTADSQVLSCSAAITQDVFPQFGRSYAASKVATIAVTMMALGFAIYASSGVFVIVLVAWAAMSAMFGPILLVRLAQLPLPTPLALTMMALGLSVVIAWGQSSYADAIYGGLPGLIAPSLLYAIVYQLKLKNITTQPDTKA
jgi:sodium/proline symporter